MHRNIILLLIKYPDVCCAQVTDHATTALLHYQLPQMPDVVVRSFMVSSPWCFFKLHFSAPASAVPCCCVPGQALLTF